MDPSAGVEIASNGIVDLMNNDENNKLDRHENE